VYVLSIVCKFFLSSTLLHNELGGDVHFRCTCSSNLVVAAYFNSSSHSFTLSLMIPILLQIKFLVGCRLIMREDRVWCMGNNNERILLNYFKPRSRKQQRPDWFVRVVHANNQAWQPNCAKRNTESQNKDHTPFASLLYDLTLLILSKYPTNSFVERRVRVRGNRVHGRTVIVPLPTVLVLYRLESSTGPLLVTVH